MNINCACRLIVVCICCLISITAKSKTLFYQPQNRDISVTQSQWDEQLEVAYQQGFREIVIQWLQFGNTRFIDSEIINRIAHSSSAKKFNFWVGLYLPENYYKELEGSSNKTLEIFRRVLQENTKLIAISKLYQLDNQLNFKGWYLPTELTRKYLPSKFRAEVFRTLGLWRERYNKPIGISYFVGYKNQLAESLEDIKMLKAMSFDVFLQQGNGLQIKPNITSLLPKIGCDIYLVHEVFVETPKGIVKSEKESEGPETCHQRATFSLRYLPFSELPTQPK